MVITGYSIPSEILLNRYFMSVRDEKDVPCKTANQLVSDVIGGTHFPGLTNRPLSTEYRVPASGTVRTNYY